MFLMEQQTENTIVYMADKEDDQVNIKDILKKKLNLSSRLLARLKREQSIFINNSFARYHQLVNEGDIIKIVMAEEANRFEPENLPFHIEYEDEDIIIVNKEPGMVTHPTKSHFKGTVANAGQNYLLKEGKDCRIRFVNRLDMDTSGLLIIAKNPYAHHILSMQMQKDQVEKKYLAFVEGIVKNETDQINAPIYRPTDSSIERIIDPRGQESITNYKVLKRYKKASLVEVQLLTGRTHQIRVHMKYIGHPLLGDSLYGQVSDLVNRQALHASYLKFIQPRYRNIVEVGAELPKDLVQLEKELGAGDSKI